MGQCDTLPVVSTRSNGRANSESNACTNSESDICADCGAVSSACSATNAPANAKPKRVAHSGANGCPFAFTKCKSYCIAKHFADEESKFVANASADRRRWRRAADGGSQRIAYESARPQQCAHRVADGKPGAVLPTANRLVRRAEWHVRSHTRRLPARHRRRQELWLLALDRQRVRLLLAA